MTYHECPECGCQCAALVEELDSLNRDVSAVAARAGVPAEPGDLAAAQPDWRTAAALTALDFLSDRIYHQVFEDGSDGGDHLEAIRAALSRPAPEPLDVERVERAIQAAYDRHDDHRTRHPGHTGECQDDWPSAWRLAPLVLTALATNEPSHPGGHPRRGGPRSRQGEPVTTIKTTAAGLHPGHEGTPDDKGKHRHTVDVSGLATKAEVAELTARVDGLRDQIGTKLSEIHARIVALEKPVPPIPGPEPTPDPEPDEPPFMSRPPSATIRINGGGKPVVIENKSVRGGTVNNPVGYAAIIENATDLTIIGFDYEHVMAGLYIVDCRGKLRIEKVRGRNVGGAVSGDSSTIGSGKGNHIQFSRCQFEGHVADSMFVGGRTEDALSNYQTGGYGPGRELVWERIYVEGMLADTPQARAWVSNSGTGIILGDSGGSFSGHTIVQDSVFLNAGALVIQHIDGPNLITRRNTILSEKRPLNNQPFGSWSGNPRGEVTANRYYVTREDGSHPDGYWPVGSMNVHDNIEDPTLSAAALRRAL